MTDPAYRLSTVVMCHPRRADMAYRLAGRLTELTGTDARTVFDPDPDGPPSALRTAVQAWAYCDGTATHHAVFQDDIEPTGNLRVLLTRAVREHPDAVLTFYANSTSWNGAAGRAALLAGYTWVTPTSREYFPTLAVVMPCPVAHAFSAEAAERLAHKETDDDEVLVQFLLRTGTPALLRVPNLVQHGWSPSLSGYDSDPVHHPDQFGQIRRSVCFGEETAAVPVEAHLDTLPGWPHFSQRRALLCLPSRLGRARWQTQTRTNQLRVLGTTMEAVNREAESALAAIGTAPERPAAARRFVRELYLAGYGLGWVVAGIRGGGPVPERTPVHDAAVNSYLDAGLCKLSTAERWHPYREALLDLAWRALRHGYRGGAE